MIAHFSAAPFIVVSQTGRPLRRVFFLFLKHTVFTAVDEVDQPAKDRPARKQHQRMRRQFKEDECAAEKA